jgi:DNA-binding transcriptional ArsR family regulator
MPDKGHIGETRISQIKGTTTHNNDFVLEKSIFSNIFEKDIQRVYLYKKTERLAKAIHLITPAFAVSTSLKDKLDSIAVGLIDAAILPPASAKEAFSRELLALSSVLAIARSGGLLSHMNAALIADEAHALLAEVAAYEEPRLFLDDSPTLADLAKSAGKHGSPPREKAVRVPKSSRFDKGHISDIKDTGLRRDAILSVLKHKGSVYIKDISTIVRDISEKTIQRELQRLVREGVVLKTGSRRWTAYSLI